MYVYDLKFMEGFEYVKVNQIARQSYLSIKFRRAPMYVKTDKEKLQKIKLQNDTIEEYN